MKPLIYSYIDCKSLTFPNASDHMQNWKVNLKSLVKFLGVVLILGISFYFVENLYLAHKLIMVIFGLYLDRGTQEYKTFSSVSKIAYIF